mmetsp:Transcript_6636/g.16199  ORF Transcript_6636/g.16199 Transcript_6636/m.16199 type:complete len:225 (-) Transcript_6636:225-899(-)
MGQHSSHDPVKSSKMPKHNPYADDPTVWNDWVPKFGNDKSRGLAEWKTPSEKDVQTVTRQLGRIPQGIWEVATRCPSGHPQTIRVYPLKMDRKSKRRLPHPTHFWLSCRAIVSQIGVLERAGGCIRAKKWLLADEKRQAEYKKNHMEYAATRWNSLKTEDAPYVANLPSSLTTRLKFSGIGGAINWDNCKCLHQIYAHHLVSGNNVLGSWIESNCTIKVCTGSE